MSHPQKVIMPWARVVILLVALAVIIMLSRMITGSIIPTNPREAMVFQNALLLIVFGSALVEYKFTKPADSAINGLIGSISLITVYGVAPTLWWWVIFAYCLIVFLLATTCITVSSHPNLTGWREYLRGLTYKPSVVFGKARVLFSVVFLSAVFWFYGVQSSQTVTLVVFWGVFIAIWPLGVPELLSAIRHRVRPKIESIGYVIRTDWPNVVRVALQPAVSWSRENPKVLQQSDGNQCYVVPLYHQVQEDGVLGTGLCVDKVETPVSGLTPHHIYSASKTHKTPEQMLGGELTSKLIGFVDVDSTIGRLRFETWEPLLCWEGRLVWCNVGKERVHYQITEGATKEEGI